MAPVLASDREPPQDAVASCVGRGSPKHLFYWRHSPELLATIDEHSPSRFDVHADTDMLFLRTMDLLKTREPDWQATRHAPAEPQVQQGVR